MNPLVLIIIGSLFSLGISIFSEKDMPLHWWFRIWDKLAGDRDWLDSLFKPIAFCYICMGWFYATLLFILMTFLGEISLSWWWLPVIALGSSTLNAFIGQIFIDESEPSQEHN